MTSRNYDVLSVLSVEEYLRRLRLVLDYRIQARTISKQMADSIWQDAAYGINQGFPVTDLPNYEDVSDYDEEDQPRDWPLYEEMYSEGLKPATQTDKFKEDYIANLRKKQQQGQLEWNELMQEHAALGSRQRAQGLYNMLDTSTGRPEMAREWESWRSTMLETLGDDPRSWIVKDEIEKAKNPYETTGAAEYARAEATLVRLTDARKEILARLRDSSDRLTPDGLSNPDTPEERMAAKVLSDYDRAQKEISRLQAGPMNLEDQMTAIALQAPEQVEQWLQENQRMKGETGYMGPARPATPATPDWLPAFAPGLAGKANIQKAEIAPPSGQQWMGLEPSKREMLKGFADWNKKPWGDIEFEMQRRRTNTPYVPYNWMPANQRRMM